MDAFHYSTLACLTGMVFIRVLPEGRQYQYSAVSYNRIF